MQIEYEKVVRYTLRVPKGYAREELRDLVYQRLTQKLKGWQIEWDVFIEKMNVIIESSVELTNIATLLYLEDEVEPEDDTPPDFGNTYHREGNKSW